MDRSTNYILLFTLLIYLKMKDNKQDCIKIIIPLGIVYIIYGLFKGNNEGFTGLCLREQDAGNTCTPEKGSKVTKIPNNFNNFSSE